MRLLDEGFDVDSREEMDNNTALSEAALQGHVDICQLLLEHWADANSLGDSGRTPLYRAAFNGHLSVVMLLLQHGADPEITDKFFQRAVDVASTREVHNVLRGWDPEVTAELRLEREEDIKLRNERRIFANLSLEEREDLEKQLEIQRKQRLLHDTAKSGDVDTMAELLNTGEYDIEMRDRVGNTPLMIASSYGNTGMVSFLLRKRAKINARDGKGWTALACASMAGQAEVVRLLLRKGADPDIRNSYRKKAIDLASGPDVKSIFLDFEAEKMNGRRKTVAHHADPSE
eukprot:TRINITY_DN202_c0_g1_i15.p5 TRINITY_DN202_c0_g1~~TRINITY_DN202_c0_g1_i15.p5  ORF type:complete len:288 (+),score=84.18 TRINITY_DN202_c0_g1_i15:827-1690(+)